jgi:hypothetical protein
LPLPAFWNDQIYAKDDKTKELCKVIPYAIRFWFLAIGLTPSAILPFSSLKCWLFSFFGLLEKPNGCHCFSPEHIIRHEKSLQAALCLEALFGSGTMAGLA